MSLSFFKKLFETILILKKSSLSFAPKHTTKQTKNTTKVAPTKNLFTITPKKIINPCQITKTKNYEIKPISVEDAKLKLDEKKDMFLPFVNVETNAVNVLYQRGDGTYGIVIPE